MSLKISMRVTCDACGAEIAADPDVPITRVEWRWADWRFGFGGRRARMMLRGRYRRTPLTYCLACADGGGRGAAP